MIGNAVPVNFSHTLAKAIKADLLENNNKNEEQISLRQGINSLAYI